MKRTTHILTLLFILSVFSIQAQLRPITIEDVRSGNRINLYAINSNEKDLDVSIEVVGSGFKKPRGVARFFRVPGASKVLIQTLIVERGANPVYSYNISVNEELSRRVVRRESTPVKIDPPKNVLVYKHAACEICPSFKAQLDSSYYNYRIIDLDTTEKVRNYLTNLLLRDSRVLLDTIPNPLLSIGGKIRWDIVNYEELVQALKEGEAKENEKE